MRISDWSSDVCSSDLAIRERWAEQVNDALELAQVADRVDHRSYARQGVEMEPTAMMGHASAAIERRAEREQIAAGEEPHAVTPRGQMNEVIQERSEEHTSELQSLMLMSYAVFCLKNKNAANT